MISYIILSFSGKFAVLPTHAHGLAGDKLVPAASPGDPLHPGGVGAVHSSPGIHACGVVMGQVSQFGNSLSWGFIFKYFRFCLFSSRSISSRKGWWSSTYSVGWWWPLTAVSLSLARRGCLAMVVLGTLVIVNQDYACTVLLFDNICEQPCSDLQLSYALVMARI